MTTSSCHAFSFLLVTGKRAREERKDQEMKKKGRREEEEQTKTTMIQNGNLIEHSEAESEKSAYYVTSMNRTTQD